VLSLLGACGETRRVEVYFDVSHVDTGSQQTELCTERIGEGAQIVVAGRAVITPTRVIKDASIAFDRNTGLISCVGTHCLSDLAEGATVLCSEDLIFPALIDTHNHVSYNILSRWEHDGIFENRYEWQKDKSYKAFKEPYGALKGSFKCAMDIWGELRAAFGGAASLQGSTSRVCTRGFVRNIEESYSNFLDLPGFRERVTSIDSLSNEDAVKIGAGLGDGSVQAFLVHLAEGIDDESRDELATLKGHGLLKPGTAVIHGTALNPGQLSELADAGVSLIWSPRSNIDLYGQTTDIPTALNLGINVALAPDWTLSGSRNMLRELKCAKYISDHYFGQAISDEELVYMATVQAAAALRVESRIGSLAPGLLADILVIEGNPENPFAALVGASEFDISLLTVGGRAIFGSPEMMAPIEGRDCEKVNICGFDKRVCVKQHDSEDDGIAGTFADTRSDLEGAMTVAAQVALAEGEIASFVANIYKLFPLVGCGLESDGGEQCVFHGNGLPDGATGDDKDADGVDDTVDVCPEVFDPHQVDRDQDGLGDACDTCPSQAGVLECPQPSILDRDQDGILLAEDNCPFLPNADQADADEDGLGDVCDRCPLWSNLEFGGCPVSIISIRDPSQPDHPDQGTRVVVQDAVVTAIRDVPGDGKSIYVQAPLSPSYGGIEVKLGSNAPAVVVGELVDISGTYIEQYSVSQLSDAPEITSKGMAPKPISPVLVSIFDICDEGGLAEAYESMLVRVMDVEVTNTNPDAPKNYGEFEVWQVGSTPPTQGGLRVDDYLSGYMGAQPPNGSVFVELIGVTGYSFSHRKIFPRGQYDLITTER